MLLRPNRETLQSRVCHSDVTATADAAVNFGKLPNIIGCATPHTCQEFEDYMVRLDNQCDLWWWRRMNGVSDAVNPPPWIKPQTTNRSPRTTTLQQPYLTNWSCDEYYNEYYDEYDSGDGVDNH